MTNDIPTTPLPPEQQNVPKQCRFTPLLDGIRIFVLSLFVCDYSAIAAYGYFSLFLTLPNYFPSLRFDGLFGLGLYVCQGISFLLLAIPYLTVVFLLVKSFRYIVKFLWMQLIIYGAYIAQIARIYVRAGDSFAAIIPIFMAGGLCVALGVQAIALIIRKVVRKAIKDRKKERILGWRLLGGSILFLLILFLLLPSTANYARALNRTLQNPKEIQVGSYSYSISQDETDHTISDEDFKMLLSKVKVKIYYQIDSELDKDLYWANPNASLVFQTARYPDETITVHWYSKYNILKIRYRGYYFYADDAAFRESIAQYYTAQN